MPSRLLRACPVFGCGELTTGGPCQKHQRPSSSARLYGSRWRAASKAYLRAHPLCAACERQGRVSASYAVDHVRAHRGDARLFWDRSNWQALCRSHHNAKAALERG